MRYGKFLFQDHKVSQNIALWLQDQLISVVHVNIPLRLYERLEQVSKSNGVSSSEMLELLLRKYLILTSDGNTNDDRIGLSDDDT